MAESADIERFAGFVHAEMDAFVRERMGTLFADRPRQADKDAHAARTREYFDRWRTLGAELQRSGGLAQMHALVRALNRRNARHASLLEDAWKDMPGYRLWQRLP